MRPTRLEMQGFGPFRDRTDVDFSDHDLIVLTGPTGAGKSSIIDGIAFALYGAIARYENIKLVAPVINAVSSEARVRLDFTIADESYTAVRVVRRSANGASTKEARLEHDGEVIASTAQEVSQVVERIVGLNFGQFTKTVVLPQGEFAKFLRTKPSARQRLLRDLLGLEVFSEVGRAARVRAREIKGQADGLAKTLESATSVSVDKLAALAERVASLQADLDTLEVATTDREEALTALASAQSTLDDTDASLQRVEALSVPAPAKSFSSKLSKAEGAAEAASTKLSAATEKYEVASKARDALPAAADLHALLQRHADHEEAAATAETHHANLEKAEVALANATEAAEHAGVALQEAESALEHARLMSGAQGIASTLHVGDECPVCTQLIAQLPKHPTKNASAKALAAAERTRKAARKKAEAAIEALTDATTAEADARARSESLDERTDALAQSLAGEPTKKETLAIAKKATTADAKLATAAERVELATNKADEAAVALDEVLTAEAELRRAFTEARDAVATLTPPAPSQESVLDDWTALAEWGADQRKKLRESRKEQAKAVTAGEKLVAEAERVLTKLAAPHVAPNEQVDPDRAVALLHNAHADARVLHANAEDRVLRQEAARTQIDELHASRLRVEEVGKHLVSGAFERWILSDVMADLAERATRRLHHISGGAYSLTTDGRDFQILDHRNADELRNARTLSGGETFLTSLSLALALSESIADLASTATPPLESMFLDEGFGTLDAETLDTVAGAIEELGSGGKLVGVVTHIGDLAERIPNRFQVKPSPTGSTVTGPNE